MKAFLCIVYVCVLQVTVDAWVGIIKHNTRIPLKHEGHCYTDTYSLGALNNGEVKRIEGQCAIAQCKQNRDIAVSGCGSVGIEPPCIITDGDLSKPYPDCCFEIKCPDHEMESNSFK